ncbi:unnamed protein product [Paramecium pentaurelia]|uniref:Uncharacterized protein n=1 Tax=Paramecium pentaurelia TaxID=43138 RepID=A0A8S1XKY3_9CILI|nr:unnamed protein product [Paramecium pentaurelia]
MKIHKFSKKNQKLNSWAIGHNFEPPDNYLLSNFRQDNQLMINFQYGIHESNKFQKVIGWRMKKTAQQQRHKQYKRIYLYYNRDQFKIFEMMKLN